MQIKEKMSGIKFLASSCDFTLYEDDWNEGEGELISRWDESDQMKLANSIKGVLEQVNYLDCNFRPFKIEDEFENDPCGSEDYHEYDRFDANLLVDLDKDSDSGNGRIVKPSEERYRKFSSGELKLYALHVTVYIKKISHLNENDIPSEFKNR